MSKRTFTLAEVLTPGEISELHAIYRAHSDRPKPHIAAWCNARPDVLKRLEAKGLIVDYFSYAVEFVFSRSPGHG